MEIMELRGNARGSRQQLRCILSEPEEGLNSFADVEFRKLWRVQFLLTAIFDVRRIDFTSMSPRVNTSARRRFLLVVAYLPQKLT